MSKYIEQSKVNDEIVRVLEHTECKDEHIDNVLRAIERISPIDIVRCDECCHVTYFVQSVGTHERLYYCKYGSILHAGRFFCSYGERIEE